MNNGLFYNIICQMRGTMIRTKIIILFLGLFICLPGAKEMSMSADETGNLTNDPAVIKMTVLYDNYLFSEGTKPDWGFSCLIEGMEKTILFDTGAKSGILMHNVKQLKVDLKKVELVVISHNLHDIFEVADRITVLRLGYKVKEFKTTETTQQEVVHAITAGTLESVPGMV